jgi:UDP-N-acetyl-2-amino-2-deoxyglucuronate dehydrogenase
VSEVPTRADVRVGLVGCGQVADSHGLAVRATPGAQLTACFDVVEERRVAFARRFGCTPVDSLAVLADRCDAAVVCTPPGTHATTVEQLVAAGRDVLCEKELATSAESALRMVEAARSAGRVLAVGFRFRHDPLFARCGELVRSGEIGRVTFAHLWLPRPWADRSSVTASAFPRGVTHGHGCHAYDLMSFLFGEPDAVAGQGLRIAAADPVPDDTSAMVLRWPAQLGVVSMPWSDGQPAFDRTLTVLGSAGTVTADYLGRRIAVRTGREFRTEDVTGLDVAGVPGARLDFVRQMEDFVGAVHVRRRPAADGMAGYQAVRALLRLVEEPGWAQ